jgi:hypothetical protein
MNNKRRGRGEKKEQVRRHSMLASLCRAPLRENRPRINMFRNRKASFETDPKLVQFIVRAAEGALQSFLPEEFKDEHFEKFFNFCLARLPEVKNSDDKIIWARYIKKRKKKEEKRNLILIFRALVSSARSSKNVQKLLGFIDNGTGSLNFELDQDMRFVLSVYNNYKILSIQYEILL